eukprot:UN31159
MHFALDAAPIVATGVAGLLAGAISMGIGEWISMTAQAEGLQHELATERRHLTKYPKQEAAHLTHILQQHGFSRKSIDQVTNELEHAPIDTKLNLHAKLELNIDPEELGSPT